MDSNNTPIKIARLSNTVYSSRDVVMLALDNVYHIIGQFILADYRNELGKIDTILVIGKSNGTGRNAYSVISTSGEFVINKVDLADVSEVAHGEIHLARKYSEAVNNLDWFMVTVDQENRRVFNPISSSRIFKNLEDNYRWFYIKETRSLKREDDFLSTSENEEYIKLLLNSINKPSIIISYNDQIGDDFYIDELNTTIENPILNISIVDFTGTDITEECIVKINNEVVEHEIGDVHKFKYMDSFNTDKEVTISFTYLEEIESEKLIKFYFPIPVYYGTCEIINETLTINNESKRTKLVYSNLTNIELEYNLNRNRSLLIVSQDFAPFSHIFDVNGLDYKNDYTYFHQFEYNGGTYSIYYKNSDAIINNFKQKFTYNEDEYLFDPTLDDLDVSNYYTKTEINEIIDSYNINDKASKVHDAVDGNFAGLDSTGNLTDSGYKPSDFITEHQHLPEYTISKLGTAETGYTASYILTKDSIQVGSTINIPKDFLVKSGEVIDVVSWNGQYYNSTDTNHENPIFVNSAGKYIDFVVNTIDTSATTQHIYIAVNDLVDVYTGGNGISISNLNSVSININSSNSNGLSVTSSGLALDVVTPSVSGSGGSNGAMSATDKENLDSVVSGITNKADKVTIITITETTASITPAYNTIQNCSELVSLDLTLPSSYNLDYISQINFSSGSTATQLTDDNDINWQGDDISISGMFVPDINKRYVIMFYTDGLSMRGVVSSSTLLPQL